MPVKTQQSLSGFIRGDMELRQMSDGRPMFTAKAGQQQYEYVGPGEFRELEKAFVPIVQFGNSAKKTFEQFRPGDRFIAEGYMRERTFEKDGEQQTEDQFVVKKIGHDAGWTNYEVIRKDPAPAAEQEAAGQELSQDGGALGEGSSSDQAPAALDADPVSDEPSLTEEPFPKEPVPTEEARMEPAAEQAHRLPRVSGSGMSRQQEPVGFGAQIPM